MGRSRESKCIKQKDINHWCSVIGVTSEELSNMSDEDFEHKLVSTYDKISNQSRESCSQWCDEFVNNFGCSTDVSKNAKDDEIWTILQKAAEDIAKGTSGCNRTPNRSNQLLDEIRAILAKGGVEEATQTNESSITLNPQEVCENPEAEKSDNTEAAEPEECDKAEAPEPAHELAWKATHQAIITLLESLQEDQKLFEKCEENYKNHLSRKRSRSQPGGRAKRKRKCGNDNERKSKSTDRSRHLAELIERDACAIMRDLHRVLRTAAILEKCSQ